MPLRTLPLQLALGAGLLLLTPGCPSPGLGESPHADAGETGDAGHTEAVDGGHEVTDAGRPRAAPTPLEDDPACGRFLAGPPSSGPAALLLSRSHALVRHFGPSSTFKPADQALSAALDPAGPVDEQSLVRYAAALSGVCAVAPAEFGWPPVSVTLLGETAVIVPGPGEVTLPPGTKAVAVDLRGVPEAPLLRQYLEAAVAPALALWLPLSEARSEVRQYLGYPDQFSSQSVYSNQPAFLGPWTLQPAGSSELPLAFLTDQALAPEAARLAGALRLDQRAWLFGSGIPAEVAESSFVGGETAGIFVRTRNLRTSTQRWPDEIPADPMPGTSLDELLASLPGLEFPPPAMLGPAARPLLAAVDPLVRPATTLSRGTARAGLVTVHGISRLFYPYLEVVGDGVDARLEETLSGLEEVPDRTTNLNLVRRFGEALHDGHNFIGDLSGALPFGGYAPLFLDHLDGLPFVRASGVAGISPGDQIVSVDSTPISAVYAAELPRTSAASIGYKLDLVSRQYLNLEGPTDFGLRAPDGTESTVRVQPVSSYDPILALIQGVQRRSGPLADLGAPELYYLNLESLGLEGLGDTCAGAISQAQGAAGMVLDMRGYPGEQAFACLERLALAPMSSPPFRVPLWTGAVDLTWTEMGWSVDPSFGQRYTGPTVLLVGPTSVSAAETIAAMLVDAGRVRAVVGRPSAATNGNITYAALPGGTYFSFTGMEVLRADGSTFHGVGIVPDRLVVPTAADLASGADPVLLEAISALRAP